MDAPRHETIQPRLPWWATTWRLLLCFVISAGTWGSVADDQWHRAHALVFLDLAVGAAAFVVVLFRRRWPVAVATVLTVATVVSASAAGPASLALVSMSTRRYLRAIVPVGVLGIACDQLAKLVVPNESGASVYVDFAFSTAVTVAMVAVGMYVGSRRELVWSLRDRARAAEEQQELRIEQARSLERERIAREMHDVLAHRISLITMHSGALAYRDDLTPQQVRETAELISTKSHEALADLRSVLGALRGQEPDRPQPTLTDVEELVEESRESGERIDLLLEVEGIPPDLVGRTAYRVVQEALTNARKHAVGAPVEVRLHGSAVDGLTVRVRSGRGVTPSSTPGAGLGLVGLRERAELAGGRLETSAGRDDFVVRAWLPWGT